MAEVMQIERDDTFSLPLGGYYYNAVAVGNVIYIESEAGTWTYDTINKILTKVNTHETYYSIRPYTPMIYHNGYVYLIRYTYSGSNAAIDRFNISTNLWERSIYSLSVSSTYNGQCYVQDNKWIITAARSNSAACQIVDPIAGTVTRKDPVYGTSSTRAAASYQQMVDGYFFSAFYRTSSGHNDANQYGKAEYDGTNYKTTVFGTLDVQQLNYAAFGHGGKIYAFYENKDGFCFDTNTNLFSTQTERCPLRSMAVPIGNKIYFLGLYELMIISFVNYELTFDIKDKSGSATLLSFEDAAPITQVRFNYSGSGDCGVVLNTIVGSLSGSYTPAAPEGYKLTGFAGIRNSEVIQYPLNTDLTISISEDFTFYEVYSVYKPPATTFDINLYQCTAENNRVDKTSFLTSVGTLSGALRDECSMIAPSLVIEYDHAPEFNYVYISAFSRYFFVTGVTSVRKNLWRIDLKCDVLMTYASGILALSAYVARNENDYNDDLVDTQLPAQNDPTVIRQEIPNTVLSNQLTTEHNYVLTVVGAAEPPTPTP